MDRKRTLMHSLILTRKYQIIEWRVNDTDLAKELTDDATLRAFDALKEMGVCCTKLIYSDRIGDFQYDYFYFFLSDAQLATLKESVNLESCKFKKLKSFEIKEKY